MGTLSQLCPSSSVSPHTLLLIHQESHPISIQYSELSVAPKGCGASKNTGGRGARARTFIAAFGTLQFLPQRHVRWHPRWSQEPQVSGEAAESVGTKVAGHCHGERFSVRRHNFSMSLEKWVTPAIIGTLISSSEGQWQSFMVNSWSIASSDR